MSSRCPYAIASILVVALGACAPASDTAGPAALFSPTVASQPATVSVADQAFLGLAAQSGLAEVALAELAQQRALSSSVRDFAERMMADHTRANAELVALATSRGVVPPESPDPARQAVVQRLAAMEGSEFDRHYLRQQIAEHEVAIALFASAAQGGSDHGVQSFAAKWLPSLRDHAEHARSIAPLGEAMARRPG